MWKNLFRSEGVALLGSVDDNGVPNIKAMLAPRQMIGIKEFYFFDEFICASNAAIFEKSEGLRLFLPQGLVSLYRRDAARTMEVATEQEVKNLLWRKGDTRFYKYGVTDPDYCVLKFTSANGRFYQDLKTEEFEVK